MRYGKISILILSIAVIALVFIRLSLAQQPQLTLDNSYSVASADGIGQVTSDLSYRDYGTGGMDESFSKKCNDKDFF